MTLKFVIILQNLIKTCHRKSGKSKCDRKVTKLNVEITRIRSRVNGVLVCPGLKIIKSAHKQHCQKFYLSLFKVEVPDAKHTTSLLLQNMLDRLMVLEKQVENVVSQSALDISKLSEKVRSLNESLRSFAGNLTWGMYCMHVHNQ